MALNPRRTALLVCDMQDRFRELSEPLELTPGNAIFGFDNVAKTVARMVKMAAVSREDSDGGIGQKASF